jgi:hypothetical protein
MSLREKCAQMVFCDFRFADPDYERVIHLVKKVGLGGVRLSGGSLFDVAPLSNSLQRVAKLPLLVAADYGDGAGSQVSGATAFPPAAAIDAAGSEELAQAKGRLTAREAGAMGVRWVLGSGVSPRFARAYLAGLHEMRAMGCLGGVPDAELAREADGVAAAPGLDLDRLRGELGFGGLVVGEGGDVLLGSADPEQAVDGLERAVTEGRLSDAAVYRSVERILAAKQKLGLFGERLADQSRVEQVVGAASHRAAAQRMAEAAVTLVRGSGRLPAAVSLLGAAGAELFERELGSRVRIEEDAGTCVAALVAQDEEALARVRERAARHGELVVVALGPPSALGRIESAGAVTTYGADEASQRAAARALAGEIPFPGRLPVNLGS